MWDTKVQLWEVEGISYIIWSVTLNSSIHTLFTVMICIFVYFFIYIVRTPITYEPLVDT